MNRSAYSLFAKLVACFGSLALILLVIGLITLRQTSQLAADVSDLGRTRLPAMRAAMDADMMHDAIRSTVFAALKAVSDQNPGELKAARTEADANITRFEQNISTLEKLNLDEETSQLLGKAHADITAYFQATRRLLEATSRSLAEAEAALPAFQKTFEQLEQTLGDFSSKMESSGDIKVTAALQASSRSQWLVGIIVLAGFLFSMGLGILFSRSIVNGLKKILGHLSITSADTSLIVTQLTEAGGKLADRASSDAAALEESSASLEQLASMSKHNTDDAASARQEAQNTLTAADGGAKDLAAMQEAMQSIKDASNNIAAIIKTIDEIAFQTNILALNAAVEAARAGEAGLGFAVVADEVRSLAQRSALAAKETAAKIEDALLKSERGAAISQQLAGSFSLIVGKVREVEGFVAKIANASVEQNEGIQQVNNAISTLERGTQENAATAEESAAAGMELQSQVDALHHVALELNELLGVSTIAPASSHRQADPSNHAKSPARDHPAKPSSPRKLAAQTA